MRDDQVTSDQHVIATAISWRSNGDRVFLVTLIETYGSSPRPLGSIAAVTTTDQWVGSVSSGCIEEDVIERVKQIPEAELLPRRWRYGADRESQQRFQLPCGGGVELFIEDVRNDSTLELLLDAMKNRIAMIRSVSLPTSLVMLRHATNKQTKILRTESVVENRFGPSWQLLIIGANEISLALARFATQLDFQVTICEPRNIFRDNWTTPEFPLQSIMPDDAVTKFVGDASCAVVTVTHDPKQDDLALIDAISSPAFYIGALGSVRSHQTRLERLRQFGLSENQLRRITAPAGLAIGSKTPAEIAISIAAQLIAARNQIVAKTEVVV